MAKTTLIDKLDLEILKLLSRDSKISFSEISNLLKVSNTTIHVRIKRLLKLEVIKNFTITIDYNKLGLTILAIWVFIWTKLLNTILH